jgi:hypothetical protein
VIDVATQRARIEAYRNDGMSIDEAKRTVLRQDLSEKVLAATTVEELKEVVMALVQRT